VQLFFWNCFSLHLTYISFYSWSIYHHSFYSYLYSFIVLNFIFILFFVFLNNCFLHLVYLSPFFLFLSSFIFKITLWRSSFLIFISLPPLKRSDSAYSQIHYFSLYSYIIKETKLKEDDSFYIIVIKETKRK